MLMSDKFKKEKKEKKEKTQIWPSVFIGKLILIQSFKRYAVFISRVNLKRIERAKHPSILADFIFQILNTYRRAAAILIIIEWL